jgi:hypothetical protein
MMSHFEDDELDNLQTSKRGANNTTPPLPSAKANTEDDALPITFGDENLMRREGLELIRADQDRRIRFTILQGDSNPGIVNPQGSWVHFLEKGKTGSTVRCLLANKEDRSACPACVKGIKRTLNVACLVAQYVTADPKTGKLPAEGVPVIAIKVVRLSQSNYRNVSELIPEDGSVADIDLVMYKDPGRPIGFAFKAAPSRLKALNMQKQAAAEAKPYTNDAGLLTRFLGKRMPASRMRAELSGAEEAIDPVLDDVDEM